MSELTLIVPPIFQTELTGFRLAAEKQIRRALWRVEYWNGEAYPRVTRNGAAVPVAHCPQYAVRFVNSVTRRYASNPVQ